MYVHNFQQKREEKKARTQAKREMTTSAPNYHHTYTFFLMFVFFGLTLFPAFSVSANTLSATESLTIRSNRTILSPSETFELGFFNSASISRWYLGIWYKKVSTRTYVWVANRDNPLSDPNGTLRISDNNLVILDRSETPVWSTNLTVGVVRSPLVAELLDNEDKRAKNGKIIGSSIGVSILLLLSFIIFRFWKRKQKRSKAIRTHIERSQDSLMNEVVISSKRNIYRENKTEDLELPLMDFEALAKATNNFSNANKLGQGGFGIVYKGKLLDGKEIAVKRLSKMSLQGTDEFKNEVRLIARLQHINLVRLLGCCVDNHEKMLIYEYLENLSLDSHLFDKTRRSNLNWQMRFDITNGIARGLLYLHQDSRFRIIHRDLKVSNILLDKNMIPKISDFGMARIFRRDETEANTRKVVGTYGYMSPEYAMHGIFSIKSDVFSFGVLLLEIISGKKSTGFYNSTGDLSLLGCVWRNWKDGKGIEIIDPIIIETSSSTLQTHEILRCIQIGLLCVQERAEDRPTMSSVMVMLGSETTTIPQPKQPGLCIGKSPLGCGDGWTVNQVTLSVIDAR